MPISASSARCSADPAYWSIFAWDQLQRSAIADVLRDGGAYMDVVGQFSDQLRRTPDGWRFAHRTFTVIGTHVMEGNR